MEVLAIAYVVISIGYVISGFKEDHSFLSDIVVGAIGVLLFFLI